MRYYCAYFSHCGYSEAPIIRTGHWQYIVCTAKLAYVPVHIIGTLEYVVKTQLILKNHFIPLWFDKNATGFATNIWNTAQCTLLDHIACIPVTVYHVTKPKPLTKFKRPKMKTDARQKCSLFLVHSYFIRALVGIWKMTARGDRKIKTFFFFCSFTRNMEDNWRVANLFTHQKHFFCQNSQDWQFNSSKYFSQIWLGK